MKLTLVIPVYNGSAHIVRCLDSLLRQTYRDFEVLLFDDGSRDDSAAVIERYSREHPELALTLIRQENRGVAETRNAGIEPADTEYIGFIDQDDFIESNYLESYVQAMESSGADIVCGGYVRYDAENGKALRRVSLTDDPWGRFVVVSPWAHLYRTAFLKRHPVRYLKTAIGEDVYFTLLAYAYTDRIATIPDTSYYWVDNPLSHSNHNQKKADKAIDPFILLDALKRDLPADGHIDRTCLQYFMYRYVVWYLLFTVRRTPRATVAAQYDRLMAWLGREYPGFDRNGMISLFGPPGEPLSIRLSVWGFTRLYHLRLARPLLRLLAARDE